MVNFAQFPEHVVVHINDTIPPWPFPIDTDLMTKVLIGISLEDHKTFAYTNHTIMGKRGAMA